VRNRIGRCGDIGEIIDDSCGRHSPKVIALNVLLGDRVVVPEVVVAQPGDLP
jgi:hypothetical protein